MLEIDFLNKRSVKLIVSCLLCFIFVFSFFVITIQEAEAVATIPLVAVPIIKLLIACGVTFASVDAMLEVYNQIKGTTYYNTLTGYLLNAGQNSIEYIKAEFGDAFTGHYGSGWDPRDPTIPDLLLGTIGLMIAKNDAQFQSFLDWFIDFKSDLNLGDIIIEDDFDLSEIAEARSYYYKKYYYLTGDCDVVCNIGEFSLYLRFRKDGSFIRVYLDCNAINPDTGLAFEQISVGQCNIHSKTFSGMVNTAIFRIESLIYKEDSTRYLLGFNTTCYRSKASSSTYYTNPNKVEFNIPKDDLVLVPIEVEELPNIQINDDDNFQNDDEIEEFPLWLPLPNEIITIDPDEGLTIDPDKEIDLNTFEELMTPWVGTTWTDIVTEVPVTPTVPGYVPGDYPIPGGEPTIPELPDTPDVPDDAGEGDDPFEGADPGLKINWDPLKKAGLQNKFPFCIPWDLYNSFSSFNVQGEAPVWEITYLDDTGFVIDFGIFEPWAVIIRWGLLIFFNVGLIILTRNIIRG